MADLIASTPRPSYPYDYPDFPTLPHMTGMAGKILADLTRSARLYNGKEVVVFKRSGNARCPICTDTLTGARTITDCPHCGGSGTLAGFEQVGTFWAHMDIGPRNNLTSEMGNADSQGGRDTIVIIGAPMLVEQSLLITKDTKDVYKLVDVEPQIVAMQGTVITQIASGMYISPGSPEYKVINW